MRRRLWAAAGIVMIVLGGLLWNSSRDRLSLAESATRITSVRGWGLERPDIGLPLRYYDLMSGGAQYQWLNSQQILFFHDLKPIQMTTTQGAKGPRLSFDWPASVGTPTLYDVAHHTEQALPQLAALFRKTGGQAKTTVVSPDGKTAAWHGEDESIHLADLDASHTRQAENDGDPEVGWTADGKQFYTLGWKQSGKRSTLAVNRYDRQQAEYRDTHTFAQPLKYDMLGDGVLQQDGSLATNSFHMRGEKLMLYTITPEPLSAIRIATPTLPQDATVDALVYSPNGDRLAWVIRRPLAAPLMQRWLSRLHKTPQQCAAVYVSGAMGENMHEVVHIPFQPKGRQFYLIDYVRWQPNEKTLSFVSEGDLYTVPAD